MSAATVTAREAAEAICDMEGPLREVADILELLQEALTPAKVTLPQAGLAQLVRGMLGNVEDALDAWETAFQGTHDLRGAPPKPPPMPPDRLAQLAFTATHAAEWARDSREAWAIDPGFLLADA